MQESANIAISVTPIYAALLGLLFLRLSFKVINSRRENKVAIGDGANSQLQRAIRVHGNFAEYTPFALMLILFVELCKYPHLVVHGLGLALLLGRWIHSNGVSQMQENFKMRIRGMMLTLGVIGVSSCLLLLRMITNLI